MVVDDILLSTTTQNRGVLSYSVGRTPNEMRFDLRVRYENDRLIVQSQAANYVESVTAIVCLSHETDSAVEQIYSVGIAPDTVKVGFSKDILTTALGHRFIDPFSPSSFEGGIASKTVAY